MGPRDSGTTDARTTAAIDRVDGEIEFAADERDAFGRFRSRLEELEPTTEPATALAGGNACVGENASDGGDTSACGDVSAGGGAAVGDPYAGGNAGAVGALAVSDPPRDAGLEAVRTAYRETVMAVPHYEAEYDDSLRENVAVEFGPDLAASVVDGRSLTAFTLDALATACEKAIDERRQFLRVLRHERESLVDVRDDLRAVAESISDVERAVENEPSSTELGRLDGQLAEYETRCGDLAERRQRLLHGRSASVISGIDDRSLTRYLYGNDDRRCPALADVADCLEAIRDLRTRCLR